MEKLVVTGLGPMAPAGMGKELFWRAICEGSTSIRESIKMPNLDGVKSGEIDSEMDSLINDRKLRRTADITKYAIHAVDLAMKDAGIESLDGDETGMIVGITHGAMDYSQEYHKALVTGGVEDVSPILFSDSVLNAPAGNGAIKFGIKGPVHTIVGDMTTSVKSIMLANRSLMAGVVNKAVVVAAEEINELSFYCRSKLGGSRFAEGAGAILIEKDGFRQGVTPYCFISGFASCIDLRNPDIAFQTVIEKALSIAEIRKEELSFAMIDAVSEAEMQYLQNIPTGSLSRQTGNAFNVSASWSIIIASMIIKYGTLPDSLVNKEISDNFTDNNIEHVLICNSEETGAASALILSRYL